MNWKDITTYSRNDEDRTPRTWELSMGDIKIIVTRYAHCPDAWFLQFSPFFDLRALTSKEIEAAKQEALNLVKHRLTEMLEALNSTERKGILLRAAYDLLHKQDDSCYILNLLEETAFYDETDCDGYCLMEDIKIELGIE